MKIIQLYFLGCLLLTAGCGQLKLDDTKVESASNAIFVVTDVISSRMTIQTNQEVPIQSYVDNSITGSGIYNQALVSPPVKGDAILNISGIDTKDSDLFVGYKGINDQSVNGSVDIVNVSNPNAPYISDSYEVLGYDVKDIKVKQSILFVLSNSLTRSESSLIMVDISDRKDPKVLYKKDFLNEKSQNLDILNDTLMVFTSAGNYQFDVENNHLELKRTNAQALFFGSFNMLYDLVLRSVNNSLLSVVFKSSTSTQDFTINSQLEEVSKFKRQNALIYLNNADAKLSVLDISQTLKNKPVENVSNISVFGEPKGISFDQQKVYLAQGSEGLLVVNSEIPDSLELKGKLLFNEGPEVADNAWAMSKNSYKLILLNDQLKGLRILKEPYNFSDSSSISFFARGQNNLSMPAKVLVKVNGTDFQSVDLNNTVYQLFTLNYTRPLTSSDSVEVILLSPNEDQSAFISYVRVNNHYCYQGYENNQDNSGLLTHLQTIKASQQSCDSYVSSPLCVAGSLQSPPQSCNLPNNRLGSLTCDQNGLEYECSSSGQCQVGFTEVSGSCVPVICSANTTADCSDSTTNKTQTCNSDGTAYGACTFSSCNTSYTLVSGQCELKTCTPNSSAACSVANGVGSKVCNSDGTLYGSCTLTSCLDQSCSPNSTGSCSITNGSGSRTCDAQGSSYGACGLTSCNSGYHAAAGLCQPNVISCTIANGSGTQIWNSISQTYDSCTVSSCISDAYQSGNSCILYCPNPLLIHTIVLGAHLCL